MHTRTSSCPIHICPVFRSVFEVVFAVRQEPRKLSLVRVFVCVWHPQPQLSVSPRLVRVISSLGNKRRRRKVIIPHPQAPNTLSNGNSRK